MLLQEAAGMLLQAAVAVALESVYHTLMSVYQPRAAVHNLLGREPALSCDLPLRLAHNTARRGPAERQP